MGSDTTTDLQVFQKKVRALKLTDSNSAYESVRKHLELSLGDDSNIHIKALLIKVTHICYPNRKIEADAVLAALGLLEGYNNYGNDFNLEKGRRSKIFTHRTLQKIPKREHIFRYSEGSGKILLFV